MSAMPALRLSGLAVRYRTGWLGRPSAQLAVDDVSLSLARGELVGLVGESGSGKTSLARAALGLVEIEAGEVEVLGQDWRKLGGRARRALTRRAQLLLQSADAALNPGLRVIDILRSSARLHRPSEPADTVVAGVASRHGLAGEGPPVLAIEVPKRLAVGTKPGLSRVFLP